MRKYEKLALFLVLSVVLLALTISALKTDSSNYNQSVVISDGGATNISSSTYQQGVIVGEISGETSSSEYKSKLGFFYGAVIGDIPLIVLNKPINGSFHTVSYVLLNATVTDPDNQNLDIYVYGANTTDQLNAGNNSLLYVLKNVGNTSGGINVTYNWTAPVIQPDNSDAGTVLLMHFDNRSQFGETTEGSGNTTYDFSGHCYDNETQILTEDGWMYFYDLEGEKVATLNQETMQLEYQLPYEKQEFDYNKEMYKIMLEDGSDLLVSDKHKVYVDIKESKSSIISLVENTSTLDCCLNLGSLDQIGQFSFNASAKKGMSLSCISCLASDSDSLNNLLGIILMNVSNLDNSLLNCSELSPEYFKTSCLFSGFFNSSIECCGENRYKLKDLDLEIISLTGLGLKNETNMLVSTTNFISHQPSFLYLFHTPSLILSPISRATASNSFSDSNFFSIFSFQDNCLTFDSIDDLTNPDQLTSGNLFICSLTSPGTDNVMLTMSNTSNHVKKRKYVKVFKLFGFDDLYSTQVTDTASKNAINSLREFNITSDKDCKEIGVEKAREGFVLEKEDCFGSDGYGINNFKLALITQVYDGFEKGKDVYFLDENNNPVRIKSITKEDYSGKIYDVDVENDVVLVRRNNKTAIWSGNSNNGTIYGATFNLTGGKFAGAFEFDGVDDYITVTDSDDFDFGSDDLAMEVWVNFNDYSSVAFQKFLGQDQGGNVYWAFQKGPTLQELRFEYNDGGGSSSVATGTISWENGRWYHLAVTRSGNAWTLYRDGANIKTATLTDAVSNVAATLYIGTHSPSIGFVNGTIDEVAIWNRTLSADEIKNHYQLKSSKYYWKVNATDSSGISNESETWKFTIDATKPRINSSINNTNPRRFEGVNISANVTDDFALSKCQFVINQSNGAKEYFNDTLTGIDTQCSQNFTIGLPRDNVINFTVIVYDTANNTNQSEYIITVQNTPPPQVTLRFPATNNYTINRTPTFGWFNVTDADNDSLLFNIYIECIACSVDNRDVNVTNLNYTPSELLYLGDDNYYYNWSVRAYDNSSNGVTANGSFSDEWNITINSYVSLNLSTSTVNFGNVDLGQSDDTTDDSPNPIVLDNDGNVVINISIYAEDDLWESASNPTDKFQFKVDNSTELNSFSWAKSATNYTNFSTTAVDAVINLDYHDANDSAEIELKIEVPTDEPLGTRSSKIVFEARRPS